jgi:hypothetical protein
VGSLEHFGVAMLIPALGMAPPVAMKLALVVLRPLETVHHGRTELGPIQARAPPA